MNSPFMSIKYNIILYFSLLFSLISLVFFIDIDYAYTTFAIIINVLTFLKRKNKHVLIRKFNATSNKQNNYHHPTFVQYKKSLVNFFYCMEKNYIREKEKKFKRKKK
jgi:hypothetical protein